MRVNKLAIIYVGVWRLKTVGFWMPDAVAGGYLSCKDMRKGYGCCSKNTLINIIKSINTNNNLAAIEN